MRSGDRGSEGARSGKTKSTEKGPTLFQRFMEWVALRRKGTKIFGVYLWGGKPGDRRLSESAFSEQKKIGAQYVGDFQRFRS